MAGIDQYTNLLMHMDDSLFKDEMGNIITNKSVVLDTLNKKFGIGSAKFNGTSSYLSIPNSFDFIFTSNDFTIDFWVYMNSISGTQGICSKHTAGNYDEFYCYLESGILKFVATTNGTSWDISLTSPYALIINTWYHIAIVRSSNIFTLYINGINVATAISTYSIKSGSNNLIIGQYNNLNYFNGYIDEFRLSKEIARWINNFTPPIQQYGKTKYLSLVKQGGKYYNVNSNYQELGIPSDGSQLEHWYDTYGTSDINVITKTLNYKKVQLIKDTSTEVWSCELDANDVLDNIQELNTDDTHKFVQYDCVAPYRILDKFESQFQIETEINST